MKNALQFLLTLFTILCCATISSANIQESQAGIAFEKACVLEGEIGFGADFNAPNSPPRVLVDSNATTGLKAGPSLRGVPGAAYDLPTLTTKPSLNTRINIRGMLPAQPGRFGDGIIGGQALENNIPLITNDKALKAAVESLGGATR